MNKALRTLATRLYRAVPSRTVREMCFRGFSGLVRHRRRVADLDGLRFELDLGETIDLCLYLRQFELEVVASLRRETRAGMTVLDIGANVGAHTLLLASLVGPTGRVIAFEPTDFGWRKLQRNVSLNRMPWITTVKAALADRPLAGQRVDFRASWRTNRERNDRESVVDFLRLDDWCHQHGVEKIDLIKIDVDGGEYPVFAGAAEILAHSRPVVVSEAVAPHFSDPERNPLRVLEALGYVFHQLRDGSLRSVEELRRSLPVSDPEMTVSINVLAKPRGQATRQCSAPPAPRDGDG